MIGYSIKIHREVEDMEFPRVMKKEHVDIPEINSKRSGIFRASQEKNMWHMWNFHVSWFLAW